MDTSFVAREQTRMLGELSGFLSIPSVSALPAHATDCRRAAEWLRQELLSLGCPTVDMLEGQGHPVVWAESPQVSGPADAADLRPLRRPAARSTRRVDHAAVRAHGAGRHACTRAAPPTTRARSSACSRPTRRCSTRTGARRSTCTSSSRARRSAAGRSSPTCCARSRSAPTPTPRWCATCRTTRPDGPRCTPRSAACATPRSRSGRWSATCTPASYGGVAPNALETLVRILAELKDADGEIRIPKLYKAVEPPTKEELKDLEAAAVRQGDLPAGRGDRARRSPGSRSTRCSSASGRFPRSRSTASRAASSATVPRR